MGMEATVQSGDNLFVTFLTYPRLRENNRKEQSLYQEEICKSLSSSYSKANKLFCNAQVYVLKFLLRLLNKWFYLALDTGLEWDIDKKCSSGPKGHVEVQLAPQIHKLSTSYSLIESRK